MFVWLEMTSCAMQYTAWTESHPFLPLAREDILRVGWRVGRQRQRHRRQIHSARKQERVKQKKNKRRKTESILWENFFLQIRIEGRRKKLGEICSMPREKNSKFHANLKHFDDDVKVFRLLPLFFTTRLEKISWSCRRIEGRWEREKNPELACFCCPWWCDVCGE